jgi:hypothetical protein
MALGIVVWFFDVSVEVWPMQGTFDDSVILSRNNANVQDPYIIFLPRAFKLKRAALGGTVRHVAR